MTAISSMPNAIDRKLHRIVLESDPQEFKSFASLARHISQSKVVEFSYQRFRKLEYAGAPSIESYVSFARDIGLLDGDIRITRLKKEIRTLENFQQWLGDLTVQYLEANNASLKLIEKALVGLSQQSPSRLPTQENVRNSLDNPPSTRNFRLALRIVALLRSNVISLASRRLILMDGIVEG
jgi:hypothetical protein